MKRKYLLTYFVFCITSFIFSCFHKEVPVDFAKFESLTIYDLDKFDFTKEELQKTSNVLVNEEDTKKIFIGSQHINGKILWKGNFIGIVKLNTGEDLTILISYYGGIFEIVDQKGYYKMSSEGFAKYNQLIEYALKNTFIPSREKHLTK